jgi:hypothetical protein
VHEVRVHLPTGNHELASLIVVYDDSWWTAYGGYIEANWESTSLRRYSTLDRDALTVLVLDPACSNEGLFALLQGLRHLADISGDRTDPPTSTGGLDVADNWYQGNAAIDGDQYRGWLLGHFIAPTAHGIRHTTDLDVTWASTPPTKPGPAAGLPAKPERYCSYSRPAGDAKR